MKYTFVQAQVAGSHHGAQQVREGAGALAVPPLRHRLVHAHAVLVRVRHGHRAAVAARGHLRRPAGTVWAAEM